MLNEINKSLILIIDLTQANLSKLILIIALPWLVYFLNLFLHRRLLYLGIRPRTASGLLGIFFAPLLHANFNHLFFNSIPLLVLSNFILINGLTYFLLITSLLIITSGLLIWCFAKSGIYIGASALITGYWGLLVSNILQQGTVIALILGGLSCYYFAGIFLGIFPGKKGVSWQGHLFGLLAGILTSCYLQFI